METNKNMQIWDQVSKTPEEIIKQVKADDGKMLNSVDSIHRIKKATELFGAYGSTWGLKQTKHNQIQINNGLMIGTLEAVFFVDAGYAEEIIEFEISTSTAIAIVRDGKLSVSTKYRKILETEAITKALSRLGFNADIYSDEDLQPTSSQSQDELEEAELIDITSS